MISHLSQSFVLVTALLASSIDARMVKRQGSLIKSTAVTFGKCSAPAIQGGLGFDNRKEFSFEPVDKTSYPHTSAQNIGIITQFICDTLVNTCGASTAAHDLCVKTQAAVGAGKNDGALADRFNAAFGKTTSFATVAGSISSATAGKVNAAAASPTASSSAAIISAASVTQSTSTTTETVTVTAACPGSTAAAVAASSVVSIAAAPASAAASVGSTSPVVALGSCSDPTILFENGLDGRQQPAFIAKNQKNFNHGSALNIGVITGFISQRLQSPCNAGADIIALAAKATSAATAAGGKSGAADAWNAVFGIKTNFAKAAGKA